MKNLPAFTILEAVVSMAITAIILSIIYVVFSMVSKNILDFKNENEKINDLNRISYSINKTIFESRNMALTDDATIFFNSYSGKSTKYIFKEDYCLLSSNNFVDTFKIAFKNIYTDTLYTPGRKKAFQRLHLETDLNNKEEEFNFYKAIYPNELLTTLR